MIKVAAAVIIIAIAGLIVLTIVPEFGGYKALVVTSSSMEPTIPSGSIAFVKKVESVGNNDVVTFRMGLDPRSLTTHRIVDTKDVKGRAMYQTKGDAVGQPDVELVPFDRIVGRVTFVLPYIGYPIAFGKTQMGVVVLVVIPAAIIVYEELRSMGREVALLRKKVGKLEREAPHYPRHSRGLRPPEKKK